mgnify:CR=1 FL=1
MNTATPYYPDSFYSLMRLFITLFIAIVGNAGMWAIVVIMPNLGDEYQVTRSVLSIPYTLTMLGFALVEAIALFALVIALVILFG